MQMIASLNRVLKKYYPARLLSNREPLVRCDARRSVSFQPLQAHGLQDFLALKVRPREMLLSPILPERSLAMLYAPRGIGKSWLGLLIGLAVASGGSLLRWNAPRARRVLYVDGEMQVADLQSRLASIQAGMGVEIPSDGFRVLAADMTEHGINLSSEEGQRALEILLNGVDLLIVDNLSTLMASGSEAASGAWLPMQNWLLRLRRKGVAVLLIHHAGLNGKQRGTSRREDALDTVISLRRPDDYSPDEGARFEVHIEKARILMGEEALPFEAFLEPFATESRNPGVRWVARDLKPPIFKQAAELFASGMSVRQVAARLQISRSEAGRLRQRAVAEGYLEESGDEEREPEIIVDGHSRPN
jgi:putative DNA primase/helicase